MNPKSAYGKIAFESLRKADPYATEQEIYDKVKQSHSYDLISRAICASVIAACDAYAYEFGLSYPERDEFVDECMGKIDTRLISQRMNKTMSLVENRLERAKNLIFYAASAVHDNWRYDPINMDSFSTQRQHLGKQFQYLPLIFLGTEELAKDLKYVDAVQSHFIWACPTREELNKEFQITSANALVCGIELYGDLTSYIAACVEMDPSLSDEIKEQFSDTAWIRDTIVPQLLDKGFGNDDLTMEILQNNGIMRYDLLTHKIGEERVIGDQ